MKPTTKVAMEDLITQARQRIPFHMSFDGFCEGRCDECPYKLMEFLDIELSDWDARLKRGEVPNLGDVQTLANQCKKVYLILHQQGLVPALSGVTG